MLIRIATSRDWPHIWRIIEPIVRAGTTYAIEPTITEADACTLWMSAPRQTYVVEQGEDILGTYYIKDNQAGPGSHVCNCGYMVCERAAGKGIATQLCEHSQHEALSLGYRAMQFNFVAASNEGAVYLWRKLGFDLVGTLPGAFCHPTLGDVDAYVFFKTLGD
ncbi:MAG: GNAT family N-acetyltransferase [Pseudomonadota bacterium]